MNRQPDRRLVRRCPLDPVLLPGGDVHEIARLQFDLAILKAEPCLPFQYHDPLVLVLVVPEAFGTCLARGDDSLDADVLVLRENVDQFGGKIGRQIGEEVGHTGRDVLGKR